MHQYYEVGERTEVTVFNDRTDYEWDSWVCCWV